MALRNTLRFLAATRSEIAGWPLRLFATAMTVGLAACATDGLYDSDQEKSEYHRNDILNRQRHSEWEAASDRNDKAAILAHYLERARSMRAAGSPLYAAKNLTSASTYAQCH